MKIQLKHLVAAATLTIGLMQAGTAQLGPQSATAAGSACYSGGQVVGKKASGVRKSKAQKRARSKWNDFARNAMGTSRAHWGNAKYRGYSCKKKGIWYCRAIATPCV